MNMLVFMAMAVTFAGFLVFGTMIAAWYLISAILKRRNRK